MCELAQDKIEKSIEAISLYKENKKQSLMLIPNSVSLLQYKKVFEDKLSKLHVTSQIIDEYTSKENRWKAIYDFNNGDLDLLVGTASLIGEDIDNKNLGLIVVDEKTEFSPQDFNILAKLNNDNLDVMYLSSRPLSDNLVKLLYPSSEVSRFGFKQSVKCEVSVDEKQLRMNAYEKAVSVLKNNGQAFVASPDVSFLINEMIEKTFNG